MGVWVKMPDVRVVAEMSKTNFQNTICNISNTHTKKDLVLRNYITEVSHLHFQSDLLNLVLSKKEWPCRNRGVLPYSNFSLVIFCLCFFLFYIHKFCMKNLFQQNISSLQTQITEAATERCCSKIVVPKI